MTLQALDEADPDTRALVSFYLGDALIATTLRKVDTWPACRYCDEDIEELDEAEAGPDGLNHQTCTPRKAAARKRKVSRT